MKWLASGLLTLLLGCAAAEKPPLLRGTADVPYPVSAREAGVEGFVVVEYDVLADGSVSNARVVESEPAGVFDRAALATVSAWRFDVPSGASLTAQVSRLSFEFDDGTYDGY